MSECYPTLHIDGIEAKRKILFSVFQIPLTLLHEYCCYKQLLVRVIVLQSQKFHLPFIQLIKRHIEERRFQNVMRCTYFMTIPSFDQVVACNGSEHVSRRCCVRISAGTPAILIEALVVFLSASTQILG
jgi:hypothetical protein